MELNDLVGLHKLSGVDMLKYSVHEESNKMYDAQVINFILDGVTYSVIEDPEDGYRSSMKEIVVSDSKLSNIFPECMVMCQMRIRIRGKVNDDVLDMVDITTGKVVLSVGTSDFDDYYPLFEGNFYPENMIVNNQ